MAVFDEIVALLTDNQIRYEHVVHEKAITSMDTVEKTGYDIRNGAKSILFKTGEDFKLVIVRGDNRADFKKLRAHFGVNKIRMATPDEVLTQMRVAIGACYPFGSVAGLDMIVDHTLQEADMIHYSPGTHFDHFHMSRPDYEKLVSPVYVDIFKQD